MYVLWVQQQYRIGIGGGSCSGKTTLAEALRTALEPLSCEIVSIDRFMLQEQGPMITLSSGGQHPNNNHPDSTDNAAALQAIKQSSASVVIVEGLMALHLDEIRACLDLKLYVDLDPATRSVRRMVRSIRRRPELDPEWIGAYYLECAVPGHSQFVEPSRAYADLIVTGDGDLERPATLLATLVRAYVGQPP